MEEVILLFLYHRLDVPTLRHYEMLQRFHPRDQIVPIAYQLTIPNILPGTVDVALDWDFGWPIFSVWHEIDKIFLRWFLRKNRPSARRYVFFEYDTQPRVNAQTFYGTAWDADVAATTVKTPQDNPEWPWFKQSIRLGSAFPHRTGLVPMAATLWSNDALQRIAHAPQLQELYCELRMGTLARMFGFQPAMIPQAARTVSWQAKDIAVIDESTWFHPVKA